MFALIALAGLLLLFPAASALGYDVAGHFYTVGIVFDGVDHPLPPEAIDLITFCAWLPDETTELNAVTVYERLSRFDWLRWEATDSGPAATVGAMVEVQQLLHALTGGESGAVTRVARRTVSDLLRDVRPAGSPTQDYVNHLCAVGFALHLYGDSFAHRVTGDLSHTYPTGGGHWAEFSHPDHLLSSPAKEDLWKQYAVSEEAFLDQTHTAPKIKAAIQLIEAYYHAHPREDDNVSERRVTVILSGYLNTLTNGHPPRFLEPSGYFGEPCQSYVQWNFVRSFIPGMPDCKAAWTIFRQRALARYKEEPNARHDAYPQFDQADPQWEAP